jgi:hypothetical protein
MKRIVFLVLTMLLTPITSVYAEITPPHLDLEMTSKEYQQYLQQHYNKSSPEIDHPVIASTLKLGTRLSLWINKINEARPPELAIRLTSSTTRISYPIDKPNSYSPEIIDQKMKAIFAEIPSSMLKKLQANDEINSDLEIDDETFIKFARLIDRQYQSAARYKSLNPWRSSYAQRAKEDVRGFYFLRNNQITERELENIFQYSQEKIELIQTALINVCFNAPRTTTLSCQNELANSFKRQTLSDFYKKYIHHSQSIWNDFFMIPGEAKRTDVQWINNTLIVPFNRPSIEKFSPYLKNNVEDEFKWLDWNLKVEFGIYPNGPELEFKPGVVPHVNQLGGNQIVMDSNQSIEEYESQWTIRHEFGHVLGLPDCYHEFYDEELKAFVNYQLDTTDLMCSRAGNMNERIFNELKKTYQY